jgi:hypothetical protein
VSGNGCGVTDEPTGEICEDCLPLLAALRDENAGLQETIRRQAGALGKARRLDPDKKLREHAEWDRAQRLFKIWRHATGHTRSRFTILRFKQALPFLQEYEDEILVRAILGLAYNPAKSKPDEDGVREKYDWWQTLFNEEKSDNIERYANKAPRNWGDTLEEHAAEVEGRS